jgi:hypothetical protein
VLIFSAFANKLFASTAANSLLIMIYHTIEGVDGGGTEEEQLS